MTAVAFSLAKLHVTDLAGLEAFYTGTFGFKVVARIEAGSGEGALQELILMLDGDPAAQIRFALIHYLNRPKPVPGEMTVGLTVTDVAASLAAIVAAGGIKLTDPIPAHDYGLILGFALDPEGHHIELMQPMAA